MTGAADYPGDLVRPGAARPGRVLRPTRTPAWWPWTPARRRATPGVVAVLTAADVPVNEYGLTMFDQPVLLGVETTGRSRVAADVSRWEGDQIAVVVAETADAADRAAEQLEVEWEDLPVVGDLDAGLTDEVLVRPDLHPESNRYITYRLRKGDMAAAWEQADVVVEGTYEVPFQEHAYLQPEAGLSYIDEEGRVTVDIAGQWTHEDQEQIAHALDLPAEQVRVVYPAIGGAFGGREDMSLQIVLALASWRLAEQGERRPVRCQWSREESIVGHHKRHRGRISARWGATADGKVVAAEATCLLDAGAYNCTTNKVLGNLHLCVTGPYEIANVAVDSHAVLTNAVPGGAFRGFGAPQGAFVAETQMNKLAERLGHGSGGAAAAQRPARRLAGPHRHGDAARRQPARGHRPVRGGGPLGRAPPACAGARALRLTARRSRRPPARARVRLRVQERRLLVRLPRALRGPDRAPRRRGRRR